MQLQDLSRAGMIDLTDGDVSRQREVARRHRLRRLALALTPIAAYVWWRRWNDEQLLPDLPDLPPEMLFPMLLLSVLVLVILVPMVGMGNSPHVTYDASELDFGFERVRGADTVREEVERTLNLFLAHKTFRNEMGGTARRAILFEGPPGTGKTHMARAMAAEAGVPFLFVSSSAFQSMYYGQTNRKIRSFFSALRKQARAEGGAIGFIEELDAIGATRRGMGRSGAGEGVSGVVNELLIQLQSFDEPPRGVRFRNWWITTINRFLPDHRRMARRTVPPANVLIVGATNRADDLDPALVRPGRFDRTIHFGLPNRAERRDLIDLFLETRSHDDALDDPERRDALASQTFGYSPVMLEHLLDEALVWALRRGADRLSWGDVQQAKFTEELGLKQPVVYEPAEGERIATHEAGHATVAHYVGSDRRLEVLSIIKRRDSLGLLAHSDTDERFTRTRSELLAMIDISFGGLVAEELVLGEYGTGPSGDLHAATTLAARMVGSYGMGSSLVSFEAAEVPGAGNIVAKVLANKDARAEVEEILRDSRQRVEQLLTFRRDVLDALRGALLEREELIGEEIVDVIASAEVASSDAADYVIDLLSATSSRQHRNALMSETSRHES
ncbi:MAG: AAA family ATPase [Actinomycetota bacterium]